MAHLIRQAVEIIEKVKETAGNVWVNKCQCERLARRFGALGASLKDMEKDLVDDKAFEGDNKCFPAFDELITVLKKGEHLVLQYRDWNVIIFVISRRDNREAFKEIHGEIDSLKTHFPFGETSDNEHFETGIRGLRDEILKSDAEEDRKEMPGMLNKLGTSSGVPFEEVQLMEDLVSENSEAVEDLAAQRELPSYLKIDISTLNIDEDPVRKLEVLNKLDPREFHGKTLVHPGTWLGCKIAIKVFRHIESWNKAEMMKEMGPLVNLRHPHIVQLIGFAEDAEKACVLYELMDTDLRQLIKSRLQKKRATSGRPFSRTEALDIITQIAKGMYYLHRQGFVHGELKCSNVLVKDFGDYIDVKIGDFRCSRQLGEPSTSPSRKHRARWSPPESIPDYAGGEASEFLLEKGDIYSFGMTCYEVFSGKLPYQDIHGKDVLEKIMAQVRPELPDNLGEALEGLIKKCWDHNPENRPNFQDICYLLDYMRSTEPVMIEISSGIEKVLTRFRQIPIMTGIINRFSASGPAKERIATQYQEWTKKNEIQGNSLERMESDITIPKNLKIEPVDLMKVRLIGEGGFAKVYEVKWLGCRFALKKIGMSKTDSKALQREMQFLIQLLHPHVVRLVGFSVEDSQCSILMEYMSRDLDSLIDCRKKRGSATDSTGPFTPREAMDIISKIAMGMAFLHVKGVIHRDLKARNVLVHEHNELIDVKIVDFGVSEFIGSSHGYVKVGTGWWRAPELLADNKNDQPINLQAADVYSYAMTCYEVLSGAHPLDHLRKTDYKTIISGLRPTLPPHVHPSLAELIHKCWHQDPQRRPSFSCICDTLNKIQV